MAVKQSMVDTTPTERSLGTVDGGSTASTAAMQAAYPGSPIYSGKISDSSLLEYYQKLMANTELNDGGHMFGTVNLDYSGAPNLRKVETGGGGLPGTPYIPNVSSPGEGTTDPTKLPDPPKDLGVNASDGTYGLGGSLTEPSKKSKEIASNKIGSYVMGSADPEGKPYGKA